MKINCCTARVRYAAKTRCVSYSLHSLIHSGSCANSPFGLKHAPAFVARAQLPTEASLSSFACISSHLAVLYLNSGCKMFRYSNRLLREPLSLSPRATALALTKSIAFVREVPALWMSPLQAIAVCLQLHCLISILCLNLLLKKSEHYA